MALPTQFKPGPQKHLPSKLTPKELEKHGSVDTGKSSGQSTRNGAMTNRSPALRIHNQSHRKLLTLARCWTPTCQASIKEETALLDFCCCGRFRHKVRESLTDADSRFTRNDQTKGIAGWKLQPVRMSSVILSRPFGKVRELKHLFSSDLGAWDSIRGVADIVEPSSAPEKNLSKSATVADLTVSLPSMDRFPSATTLAPLIMNW